jgi:tetratricopeptide (TPR) repeat protein
MFKKHPTLTNFLGGLTVGIFLSMAICVAVFYLSVARQLRSSPTPAIESTPSTQTTLLDEAEVTLNSGQPEKVRKLLYPIIENWTSNEDRIRGYNLLGQAELAQGHPQLAVPYFERLYSYEPTPENLFLLATTFDAGGDNRNALEKYQELTQREDLPPEIDIEFIKLRIENISRVLGTPIPTQTDLP